VLIIEITLSILDAILFKLLISFIGSPIVFPLFNLHVNSFVTLLINESFAPCSYTIDKKLIISVTLLSFNLS
jgi:hypothetical protein